MLQEFFVLGRDIFASAVTPFITKISIAGNEDEFSYVRIVLEVFVLYPIITSSFVWIRAGRASYLGRKTNTTTVFPLTFVGRIFQTVISIKRTTVPPLGFVSTTFSTEISIGHNFYVQRCFPINTLTTKKHTNKT